ncbi:MAG: bifunctional phosphoglucose/phosphomannose isomerase [Chloroflexi bacterium]|nr:bifunctional phosphoglucose/phosphomannose isomerase [Chloroflexota bacterium]
MDLDAPRRFRTVDRTGALGRILGLPDQLRAAWSLGQSMHLPSEYSDASDIVICGMGGSAIGGDLARAIVEPEARVPLAVVRGYDLPGFVSPSSLVVLSSFSGTTEETLAAGDRALEVGARVLALTTGGTLAARAAESGFPVVRFAFDGQPREAIGYSLLLMLGSLARRGYVRDCTDDVEATALLLDAIAGELGPEAPAERNQAKRLAERLHRKVGIIYGGGLMGVVARRWKGQFNENAKRWAFFEELPELNHNAILGYQFPSGVAARVMVVILSSTLGHPRIALREAVTSEVLDRWEVEAARVEASGNSALEQVLSAMFVGDLVSYYLAMLDDVDPSDIETLAYLKARLAEATSEQ